MITKKPFLVEHERGNYIVKADENASLETVWASEKCWFTGGSIVTIMDMDGNKKTFVKEEYKDDSRIEA